MRTMHWVKIGLVAAVFAISALADHGDDNRGNNNNQNNNNQNNNNQNNNGGTFSSSIAGSIPGVTIGGVASGGVPWIVSEGRASVSRSGRVQVEVEGLLIMGGAGVPVNLVGTVGPVMMVAASVVCGGSGGMVAASTAGVPLSAGGNAEIDAAVTLPASCMAPTVLVRVFNPSAAPGSALGPFIAESGFSAVPGNAPGNDDNNNDH